MDDTSRISNIAYMRTHHGFYVVACGSEKVGTLRGNHATGFWAYLNDGTQIAGTYAFPGEAAEVLVLEAAMRPATYR